MNTFDAVVYGLAIVAIMSGFRAGLLRSVATIVGYASAMPIALAAAPLVAPLIGGKPQAVWTQDSVLVVGLFLIIGIVLGALLRAAIGEIAGDSIHVTDRLAGSLLGALRIGLVAIVTVLVFDQLMPPDREPAFLRGSQLRPVLSAAGRIGLKSLPPDVTAYIDRLKRERRISS
jgi:membrane protein required for colicin V production